MKYFFADFPYFVLFVLKVPMFSMLDILNYTVVGSDVRVMRLRGKESHEGNGWTV